MSNFALAEDNNMSTYNLYVNSKHIEENNIIMRESVMLFPFRTIFESLGVSVIWNDLNGILMCNIKERSIYVIRPNPGYGKIFLRKRRGYK